MADKDAKPKPLTPLSALAGAQTIGPPRIGVRYDLPMWGEILGGRNPLMGLLELVMGNARPAPVAAADPYGIEAAAIGAGQPPIFMGTTQPLGKLYSRVDKAVAKVPAKGAHPNKVASILKGEASAEELAYRQVPEFLAGKGNTPVTPAALEAHLAQHPAPFPQTVTRGAGLPRNRYEAFVEQMEQKYGVGYEHSLLTPDERAEQARLWEGFARGGQTRELEPKYAQYQLPGGESYRETLYMLPVEMKKQGRYRVEVREPAPTPEGSSVRFADENVSGTDVERLRQRYGPPYEVRFEEIETPTGGFTSGHFDEPNIVAHARSNVRTLPTGERGRFLEEVQSDWHQAGKSRGYAPSGEAAQALQTQLEAAESAHTATNIARQNAQKAVQYTTAERGSPEWEAVYAQYEAAERAANETWGRVEDARKAPREGVPDAPFKESWPDLTLKQQLLEAAQDPDASWLGFTSGQTQAARYDLSKQISKLDYDPTEGRLRAYDRADPTRIVIDERVDPESLADYIGKEPAEALRTQITRHEESRAWERNQWSVAPDEDSAGYFNVYDSNGELLHDYSGTPERYRTARKAEARIDELLSEYEGIEGARPSLEGLDLQVGGEGMRKFYDELLPKRLAKIVKPFGGTVERAPVRAGKKEMDIDVPAFSVRDQGGHMRGIWENRADAEAYLRNPPAFIDPARSEIVPATTVRQRNVPSDEPAWIVRLTPEMKQRILKEGLPLMTPLAALGGAAAASRQEAR